MQVRQPYWGWAFNNGVGDAKSSTAYNVDVALAARRNCFEGNETWLTGGSYAAGDIWGCVGLWFSGRWYDAGAQQYIADVQDYLTSASGRPRLHRLPGLTERRCGDVGRGAGAGGLGYIRQPASDEPGGPGGREASVIGRAGSLRSVTRRSGVLATTALMAWAMVACSSSDDNPVAMPSTPPATPPTTPSTAPQTTPPITPPPASPAQVSFPVRVSENHRYLVDQDGQPYMLNGDSPQCLSANLSVADMEYFFANRAGHGFNAAWVNLLCGPYTFGRSDASTFDKIQPFTTEKDLSTPNPQYWERMDVMVDLAKKYGITLVLDPAETGSFTELLKDNGVDKSRAFGQFLGERYRDDVNIIWMLGNDYGDWDQYDEYEVALSKGIRDADPKKLQTIELNPPTSTSFDDTVWPPLIDMNAAYSYTPTYDIVLRAYNETPTMPVFMVEANYEYENNDKGPETTDVSLRRQEYWSMLSGATGQLYGNKYTWGLQYDDWKSHFDTPAVSQYTLMARFFGERAWQNLVPDQGHHLLTDGAGEAATTGDVLESAYATAATTADGSLAVVYVPTARTVTVDTSALASGVKPRWFDPTDGSYRDAAAPYATPGKNAAGEEDWVLVFEAPK